MSDRWFILQHGAGAPDWNMACDEALLESAASIGSPILRFYSWNTPAATFGYFQKYCEVATWTSLRPLIRRPTGGGLVPHAEDWTYSVIIPPAHSWYGLRAEASYQRIHEWVASALANLQFAARLAAAPIQEGPGRCFAGAEKFDVLFGNDKIAGAAQRRNQHGLLIQGSIQPWAAAPRRADWQEQMLACGTRKDGIEWLPWTPSEPLLERIQELTRDKYAQDTYNQRR